MRNLTSHINDILETVKRFVFLFAAFLGVYLIELFFVGYESTRLINLIENIAFSCLLFSVFWLLFDKRGLRWFSYVFWVLMMFTILEGVYFLIFSAEFTPSAIFIALDTNKSELGEFLTFHLTFSHCIFALVVLFSFFISWTFFKPTRTTHNPNRIVLSFIILAGVFLMSKPKIYNYNAFHAVISSVVEYNKAQHLLKDIEAIPNPFKAIALSSDTPKTHVVIIGESTSRLHFGLYGYHRNTTPKLSELKEELSVFSDVVSGDTYTIGSLVKAMVIHKDRKAVGNIIQLMKQAGFKTYWLSNQPPIGMFETLVTKIGLSADESHFINAENYYLPTRFDEDLLPVFANVLDDKASKKIIFIHLMGAHADYAYRYPKPFAIFPTDLDNKKQNTINHYDNAIMYTDHVLRSIIDTVKTRQLPSSVLYFSDHGEEVYDTIDFVGHPPNGAFSFNMIEIPFLLWDSKKKKMPQPFLKRKFLLNDLPHAIADLYGISSSDLDTTRSVFHKSFIERPRMVWDTILVK
jgi:heptose-I-phosphate ethanolaminephosphotransferase